MNLRRTNSCAKYIVESWSPFKQVMSSGPDLVRAAIAIKASKFLTVTRLLAVTFGDRCELCGQFGSFVQLVKCMRCCFHCLTNDRRLHCVSLGFVAGCIPNPMMGDRAVTILGLRILEKYHECVPKVLTITQDSFWGYAKLERDWAVDYTTALEFFRPSKKTIYIPSILQRRIDRGKGRACYYEIPPLVGRIHAIESKNLRFMTAIHLPGIIKRSSSVTQCSYHGILCRGCRFFWGLHSQGRHHLEHVMYSASEIVPHLEKCPYAKVTWNLVLKMTTPSPSNGMSLIPLHALLARAKHFRYRRSVNLGEMPWQFRLGFYREYEELVQRNPSHHPIPYGDNLIEETQASWALARPLGPSDMHRYLTRWKAWKAICKQRRIPFGESHDL